MPFTIGGDWIPSEPEEKSNKKVRPVKVRTEKRKQKVVTVVLNLRQEGQELKDLARTLKQACGGGGTVKDGVVEIQGDKVEKVREELLKLGIKSQ